MAERRADPFVVWLIVDDAMPGDTVDDAVPAGMVPLRGRVEHVASGARGTFRATDELIAFLERWLTPRSLETDHPTTSLGTDHPTTISTDAP